MSERRAMISAWQSLSARPRSLMYSPFIHLVPVETQITWASFTSVPEKGGGGQERSRDWAKLPSINTHHTQKTARITDLICQPFPWCLPRMLFHRQTAGHWTCPLREEAKRTCCHDNPCQDFPPCMGGCKVVSQLTELVHHQTGDCVGENLRHHAVMKNTKLSKTKLHQALSPRSNNDSRLAEKRQKSSLER